MKRTGRLSSSRRIWESGRIGVCRGSERSAKSYRGPRHTRRKREKDRGREREREISQDERRENREAELVNVDLQSSLHLALSKT